MLPLGEAIVDIWIYYNVFFRVDYALETRYSGSCVRVNVNVHVERWSLSGPRPPRQLRDASFLHFTLHSTRVSQQAAELQLSSMRDD